MARWSMTLRRSPSVMLNAFAVPARNASTLGKLNTPVPSAKFSLMKCRYSPPSFIEWRPLARLNVSTKTYDVSNRPWGAFPVRRS